MKGGFTIIPSGYFDLVKAAVIKFQQEVTDKKAMILPTYNTVLDWVCFLVIPCWNLFSDTQRIG